MAHYLAETAPELRVEVTHSETAPALADLRSRSIDLVAGVEYDVIPVARHVWQQTSTPRPVARARRRIIL